MKREAGNGSDRPEKIAVAITVFGLAAFSYLRRFPGFVEVPYWYLTYTSGFIRRGLVGTFVSPFIVGLPPQQALVFISGLCTLLAAVYLAVVAILAAIVYEALESRPRQLLWLALVAVALASPGLPMLANDFGTFDPLIALVAALVTIAAFRCAFWSAMALSVIGPLVHEAFFFLALPLLGGIWWGWDRCRHTAIVSAATIISMTLITWKFSTADFHWQPGIPLAPSDLMAFAHWQLGQSVVLSGWPDVEPSVWFWALGSTSAMIALLWPVVMHQPRWACTRVLAGTLFTVSILIIATDTERLLDWACLTAPMLCGIEALRDGRSLRTAGTDRRAVG